MARFFGTVALFFLLALVWDSDLARCQEIEIPPFPPDVEGRCLLPGLSFLKGCESYTKVAFKEFGITSADQELDIAVEEVIAFLDNQGPPNAECCLAACNYANTLCNCEPVATKWSGDLFFGAENYKEFTKKFAEFCGHVDLIGQCPEANFEEFSKNTPPNECVLRTDLAPAPAPEMEDPELELERDLEDAMDD